MTTLSVTPTITLRDVLDDMDAGHVFAFRAYSHDKKRRKSGKMIEHHTAKLLAHNADKLPEHQNAGALMMTKATPVVESISRKPNHRAHFTRNIAVGILLGEHFRIVKIVKIHMDLMTRYNGRKIILP